MRCPDGGPGPCDVDVARGVCDRNVIAQVGGVEQDVTRVDVGRYATLGERVGSVRRDRSIDDGDAQLAARSRSARNIPDDEAGIGACVPRYECALLSEAAACAIAIDDVVVCRHGSPSLVSDWLDGSRLNFGSRLEAIAPGPNDVEVVVDGLAGALRAHLLEHGEDRGEINWR